MEDDFSRGLEFGISLGMQMVYDKIRKNHSEGKPIMANDNELYWMKNSIEHLSEVMDAYGRQ